jgi:hypothetical protein
MIMLFAVQDCDCADDNFIPGKPQIQLSTYQLDFGAVKVGKSKALSLEIENIGTALLFIDSITIDTNDFFVIKQLAGSPFEQIDFLFGISHITDLEQTSVELIIEFYPQEVLEYSGQMIISSDAENEKIVTIDLLGSGGVPDIEVVPSLLDFGLVRINSSSILGLTVENQNEVTLSLEKDSFHLGSLDPDSPFFWQVNRTDVEGGGQTEIEVVFAPESFKIDPQTNLAIPHLDTLFIYSDDPDENPVEVALRGQVSDNVPPVASIKIIDLVKLDGQSLDDLCQIAPTDTIKFEARAFDPEGEVIRPENYVWSIESRPGGSIRNLIIPTEDKIHPSFVADITGEYTICLKVKDLQQNWSSFDPELACSCQQANQEPDSSYGCPCVKLMTYPREDIRIELVWDSTGPDLDLHLLAPGGDFCSATRDCRQNEDEPENDVACVEYDGMTLCMTPNCDAGPLMCHQQQVCYDKDEQAGPLEPACVWKRCSGTDCFWNGRNPDWGVLGDESDDPRLDIDCPGDCRAENINLNNPAQGIYTIMVDTYSENRGDTLANVKIFFKGDLVPSYEFEQLMPNLMPGDCSTWNVALIDWVGPEDHTVIETGGLVGNLCCR